MAQNEIGLSGRSSNFPSGFCSGFEKGGWERHPTGTPPVASGSVYAAAQIETAIAARVGSAPGGGAGLGVGIALTEVDGVPAAVGTAAPVAATDADAMGGAPFAGLFRQLADAQARMLMVTGRSRFLWISMGANALR